MIEWVAVVGVGAPILVGIIYKASNLEARVTATEVKIETQADDIKYIRARVDNIYDRVK